MNNVHDLATRLRAIVSLEHDPVGVFLLKADADLKPFESFKRVQRHRYCQLLMKARSGESLLLEDAELACPAAAAAFGMSELPEGLAHGKGLVGLGIVAALSILAEKALPRSRAKTACTSLNVS